MLVLTRKVGQEVVIGGGIRVRVCAAGPGAVRLGVEAPPGVRVDRAEVAEARARDGPGDDGPGRDGPGTAHAGAGGRDAKQPGPR